MEILACPDTSFAVPQVILGENVQLPQPNNPDSELNTTAVYLPPKVEVYSPRGELLPSGEAIGTLLNLLF